MDAIDRAVLAIAVLVTIANLLFSWSIYTVVVRLDSKSSHKE